MSDLLDLAAQFFGERKWPHRRVENPRAIEVTHEWSGLTFHSYAQEKKDGRVFIYYSVCPDRVAPERTAAVNRYIARVNFGLLVGAFELDLDSGEVRFRSSIDLDGQLMTSALMTGVVNPNHQAMQQYFAGLLDVLHGDKEPDQAFREAMEEP